uniref:DUF659 domain-containing protein n=1 Tax=Ditylenchus dipsaci TaxID=166011 RepID=A0A915EIV7_9BILA
MLHDFTAIMQPIRVFDRVFQGHGKFIVEVLSKEIIKLGKQKVVAVVTDHAANMKNAWKKLAGDDDQQDPEKQYTGETFPWILFEGCKAHAIDLAAKDICAKTTISDCLKSCVEVAKFFR